MKRIVTLATTFALSFGLMGTMAWADSDGDRDGSNARRLAHHQRVERERLTRHQRRERRRAKESDVSRRRVAKHQVKERKRLQRHQREERKRINE
jgi:hypothetical protein